MLARRSDRARRADRQRGTARPGRPAPGCAWLATASMMRCISRPKPTSCQPITPRLTRPTRRRSPRRPAPAEDQRHRASRARVARAAAQAEARQPHRAAHPQKPLGAAVVLGDRPRPAPGSTGRARSCRSQLLQPVSGTTKYFCGSEKIHQPAEQRFLLGRRLAPIRQSEGAAPPRDAGALLGRRRGRYGRASASP